MNRINIYEQDQDQDQELEVPARYAGWFDSDAAKKIASYSEGEPYTNGKILLVTKKRKLVVNEWNNSGYDNFRFANDEREIAQILSEGGYDGDDKKLSEILEKYEI